MDLNEILVFVEVAESKSFTTAAKLLGIPKSTVSRRIRQLEERLSVRLIQRTTRKLSLTDAGLAYYGKVASVVAQLQAADEEIIERSSTPRGRLRITAPVDAGEGLLPDIVAEYLNRYPEVSVDLVLTGRMVDLVDEGFDLALRAGRLSDSSLVAKKLADADWVLCASPEYLAKRGIPATAADLEAHDCIVLGDRSTWKLIGPEGLVEVEVSGRITVDSFGFIQSAAERSLGIALVPEFRVIDELHSGRLRQVLADHRFPPSPFQAVYPSGRQLPAKTRAFLDLLFDRFSIPSRRTRAVSTAVAVS
ncbi:MAG: LysR family transcriptional regulator [Deltaproteobacteria bacterium]|nr:LysR family transcriptional regulator [Deltaproteobacteria bacterium]